MRRALVLLILATVLIKGRGDGGWQNESSQSVRLVVSDGIALQDRQKASDNVSSIASSNVESEITYGSVLDGSGISKSNVFIKQHTQSNPHQTSTTGTYFEDSSKQNNYYITTEVPDLVTRKLLKSDHMHADEIDSKNTLEKLTNAALNTEVITPNTTHNQEHLMEVSNDTRWIPQESTTSGEKSSIKRAEMGDEGWISLSFSEVQVESTARSETDLEADDNFKDFHHYENRLPKYNSMLKVIDPGEIIREELPQSTLPGQLKGFLGRENYAAEKNGRLQFETDWLLANLEDFIPDNVLCRNHTALFLKELQNLTLWAIFMLDATSKIPEGILQGNIRELGNFDECLGVRATTPEESEMFRGQYCLANLQVQTKKNSTHQSILDRLLDVMTAGRRSLEITRRRKGNFLPHFALFEWATCVPSTCTPQDVQRALNSFSSILQLEVQVNITVDPENCQMEENLRLETQDIAMLATLLLIALLMAAGSLYDLKLKWCRSEEEKTKTGKLLLAFSLQRNIKKLLDTRSNPGSFKSVEGIRFLTILWVIWTHKVFSMSREPWTNKTFLLQMAEPVWKMPLQNSMLNVDTFFVVSGMLRAYNSLREMDKKQFGCCWGFLQRYLRLTPAYAVVIGIWATLLVHLGSGPTWYRNIVLNSEHCRDNWPLNILYVSNYIQGHDMCMPHTWYLAADMQMFLLAPLIVYPMWRWSWLGRVLLVLALAVSIVLLFAIIFIFRFLGIQSAGFHDVMLQDYTIHVYLPTHMRFSSYLVGLALGYIFHHLDARPEFSLSKLKVMLGWLLCLLTLAAVVFGPYSLMTPGTLYRPLDQGVYGSLHRVAWALGVAWIIFACHKDYGGPVNRLLSLPLLRPLARLTYSIYLVHMAVILVGTARLRTPLYMDEFYAMHSLVADVVISIALAVILYLSVELPFVSIAKLALSKHE